MNKEKCCLCGKLIMFRNSHNAMPVKEGRSCEDCNYKVVFPERIKLFNKDLIFMPLVQNVRLGLNLLRNI